MKKLISIAILLALVLGLSVNALAADEGFDPGVTISPVQNDSFTVTVNDNDAVNAILAEKRPTLTVPCPSGWTDAEVSFNSQKLDGVLFSSGEVSFTVAAGGVYTVTKAGNSPAPSDPPAPIAPPAPEFPFIDVDPDSWSYDDIFYAWENGLMNGVSDTEFAPQDDTSRAMIVTILWRLSGEPVVNYAMSFEDVEPDQWYTEAVRWAQSTGIVTGYSEAQFGPSDVISREQMAVILYRYAEYKGLDVSVDENTNFLSYNDFWDVSEYAKPAMMWALENELIRGSDGNINPQGSTAREQAAAILHRFCENV